jgi:hypothetical protein
VAAAFKDRRQAEHRGSHAFGLGLLMQFGIACRKHGNQGGDFPVESDFGPKRARSQPLGNRIFAGPNLETLFPGVFTPVLAKHSKAFSLIDCISVGVDRMQRNFEPMRKQVEAWQKSEFSGVTAKVVIYEAFVEGQLEAPKHLARTAHELVLRTEV